MLSRYPRAAQTMSLVHLIELLLALLVLAVIGVGLVGMVTGISFLQQYFAKDNAYMVESLLAVPNGEVEYGYLWNAKDFTVQFSADTVSVGRVTRSMFMNRSQSVTKSKAHGMDTRTVISPQTQFFPRYFQYSVRGLEERTITIIERVALQACPSSSSATTISLPVRGDNSVSAQLTGQVVEAVRTERVANPEITGPSVAVVFRAETETNIIIYNRVLTDATQRLACTTARSINREGTNTVQESVSNMPSDIRTVDADIVILIRGSPQRLEQYRTSIVRGLLDYWASESANAAASTTPPAPSTGGTS